MSYRLFASKAESALSCCINLFFFFFLAYIPRNGNFLPPIYSKMRQGEKTSYKSYIEAKGNFVEYMENSEGMMPFGKPWAFPFSGCMR